MTNSIQAVLFDLDGTLIDTAPDLAYALNLMRQAQHLPEMPLAALRPIATLGSKAMIKHALGMDESDPRFAAVREEFLALYQEHLAKSTQLFPHMDKVLNHLDEHRIPWGIVTNKLTRHTDSLLKSLNLAQRTACIVSGDTLSQYKPHPEPILHACRQLKVAPMHCVYIGDAETDVTASKAAGTKSLVALYGYLLVNDDPFSWQADGYINEPIEIIDWLTRYPSK